MAKGQQKHSTILNWLLKTGGLLILLGIGFMVIYNFMPNDQKKIINGITHDQAGRIDQTKIQIPTNFSDAIKKLHHDQPVPITNVNLNVNGDISGVMNGHEVRTRLASIGMIGTDSAFYRSHAKNIQALLSRTINPKGQNQYTIKETKHHALYLFVNGKMFQQTWLEHGLAYVDVPQGYDGESTTLYTAQNNAQGNSANIWQVNGAIQDSKQGYFLDRHAEHDYLSQQDVKFSSHGNATNFWGRITKALR